jgi:hypothetical protein
MYVFVAGNRRALLREPWKGDGPSGLGEVLSCAAQAVINERAVDLIRKSSIDSR